MTDKYDAIAEKIVAHGYLKKDEIAYIIRTELSGKTGELEAKPASVPSAEELLDRITDSEYIKGDWSTDVEKALDEALAIIESAFAAQRQAGREEALDIYNDSLVVMDIRHAELITCYARLEEAAKCVQREKAECSKVSTQAWDAIDEALDELGKARRG